MFNKAKRIASLLLALVMIFSLAACKSTENSSSDETQIVYEYEYEYEEGEQTTTSGGTQSGGKKPVGSTSGNKDEMSGTTVDLEKLKGTTVVYATWKDPEFNEDRDVVKNFEKKYDIKVKIDLMPGDEEYIKTVAARIASGKDIPDVYFSNNDFPSAMQCLQPLEAAKLDLTDDIWNKKTLELTTYGGQPYLVDTVGNIWAETDCIYYNKKLLKAAGFSENYPAELYEAGKWTWDAMEQIMTACAGLGSDTYGGAFMSLESLTGSAGCNLLINEKGTFSSGINNNFINAMKRISKWYSDGICINKDWREKFISGKVALVQTHSYGLKKTGHWAEMNWGDIGFTYLPAYDSNSTPHQTGCFRGWGLIRGAQNPEGAGVFLRYYLDSNNYNGKEAFISGEAENFFYRLTNTGMEDYNPYYTFGDYTKDLTGFDTHTLLWLPANVKPDQIESKIKAYEREAKNAAEYINDFTLKNTGIR